MGFKTTNYTIQKTMITLPEAYALIKNIRIDGKSGVAEFAIQSSRNNSMFLQPVDVVKVFFEVDRNESPYITAYRKAKESKEVFIPNPETGKLEPVIEHGFFYNWEDDNQNG
jgi:hypothetical protein